MTAQFLLDQLRGQKNIVGLGPNGGNFKIGETGYISDTTRSAGKEYYNSGCLVEVMICKATAALTAPAGLGIRFDTHASLYGLVVDTCATGEICDGILDPELTGNIAIGDTFLVYRKGPMNFVASAAISAGAGLKPATEGKFVTDAGPGLYPTRRGVCQVAASADADIRRGVFDFTAP